MFYEKHHNTRLLMVDIFCLFYIVLVRLLSLVLFHICSRAPVIAMMLAHGSSEMNELAALLLRPHDHRPHSTTQQFALGIKPCRYKQLYFCLMLLYLYFLTKRRMRKENYLGDQMNNVPVVIAIIIITVTILP